MKLYGPKNWGSFEVEPFEEYYGRIGNLFPNIPRCVFENWIHRHWRNFEEDWLDLDPQSFQFQSAVIKKHEVMIINHVSDWMRTLDNWGDALFENEERRETWLAKYVLEYGTWPAPIILLENQNTYLHKRLGKLAIPIQLIEGHMRLAYIRGLIRHKSHSVSDSHKVWYVKFPYLAHAADSK
jgi:hypothetical protein